LHIWYISHYGGGPGVGIHDRAYALARAWIEQGHRVTVFIAAFHHLLVKQETLPPEFHIDGVHYVTIPARHYEANGAGRLGNMFDFTKNLFASEVHQRAAASKPDAVIASSPHLFAFLPALRLARRHGAKAVFEIRDLWPLSITEILGVSRLHPFVQMCAVAERYALTRSDLVASVLPRADRYLAERGYGEKPFVWVPNGVAGWGSGGELSSDNARRAAEMLASWKREGRTTIVHAGSLGRPNAIDLLLQAVAVGQSRGEAERCRVLLIGSGEQGQALEALAASLNLEGVHFGGRVSKGEVATLLESTDIGYGGMRSLDRLYRYGVSLNKFADYARASLPVFLPIAPCGDPVSESGGGIARRAETPEAAWSALHELLSLSPEERRSLGMKGRAYMMQEYDFGRIAARYVEAIEQCSPRQAIGGRDRPGRPQTLSQR
jgi:glycosyltransferase involved in cell wall biosynthesis